MDYSCRILGDDVAGYKMKSDNGWDEWEDEDGEFQNGNGDNSSGFNALPGGFRYNDGSFGNISYLAFFCSASEYDASSAWYRNLFSSDSSVIKFYYGSKPFGASVRCLRDDYNSI